MPDKKKLLVFSTQLMETGGIESHIQEFISKMAATGLYELDLVVLNSQLSEKKKAQLVTDCNWVYMPSGKGIMQKLSFLFVLLTKSFTTYDALYTNGQGDSVSFISKMFRHKKWVHHHHTSGDLADQETWSDKYKESLKKADIVVACSNKNAADMMPVLKRDIISIPCFSRKIEIDNTKDKGDSKVHLGYYGRLIPEKGIDLLCRLSNEPELANVQFHIWGEGEQYKPSFFEQYPMIQYHGQFDGQKELQGVLEQIDGYLLLSVHPEGLPISLLELMSAGIPWMSTNKGGISDIVCDPEATRLLQSLEPYEILKEQINKFASDISSGKINSENQKQLYNSKFAAPVLVKAWDNALFN